MPRLSLVLGFLLPALSASAFNPPVDEAALEGGGKLVLSVGEVPEATERGKAVAVPVEIANGGTREVAGTLAIALEPGWRLDGPAERPVKIAAGAKAVIEARIVPGEKTYAAHYPVHARLRLDGKTLHAVRIFETKLPPPAPADVEIAAPPDGRVDLSRARAVRVSWERFGGPRKKEPFGWTGDDAECRLHFGPGQRADRGGSRAAIGVHPPWWNGAGTMFADYRVKLPAATPVRFSAGGALRDTGPNEPPSDGVTCRVYAAPADPAPAEPPADAAFKLLADVHVTARTWQPVEADLGAFAGKAIWLRLETHPGPKRDTTCDGAAWGSPCVAAGAAAGRAEAAGSRTIGPPDLPVPLTFSWSAEGGEVTSEVAKGPVARVSFRSRGRIEDLSARIEGFERVYAGFGNVVERPQARATLGGGGEKLTTRHAGFDTGRWSVLVATDLPADRLEIGLANGGAALHTHGEATFTVVAVERRDGEATAIGRAAFAYRDAVPMAPGRGVPLLAGRPVLDVWGGHYRDGARRVRRAAALGVRGAVLVWHNWQRWGYDYRLPDLFPPNPDLGTLEEFRDLARACRESDILFAPHDNYIDFYPDAEGFTYDDICFDEGGRPVRAWLNEGRKAQSYRFRPDRALPYAKRNLDLVAREIRPTAYFIDVFASINAFDYRDVAGSFHPFTETVSKWKEIFEHCRSALGNDAPQISEDGNDWMIGSVDGGQGNFQRVGKPGPGKIDPWAVWNLACEDAERVPWFDAVHHDRMVLHGAGYGTRYAGGEDMREHGVDSDDYLATEALAGHPPMADAIDTPGAIRKAWLLGPFARALAGKRMAAFDFAGGNLHRQRVAWEGGGEVVVNRGKDDWTARGHALPQYGFHATLPSPDGPVEAAIERRDGVIVDWCRAPRQLFVNARPPSGVPVKVEIGSVKPLGGRAFELALTWTAEAPLPEAMHVFVHFTDAQGEILFQGDHAPPQPTTAWRGVVTSTARVTIPDGVGSSPAEIRVGLWSQGGGRAALEGWDDGTRRIRLGTVAAKAGGGVEYAPPPPMTADPALARMNPGRKRVAFPCGVTTNGAVRLDVDGGALRVTPLPASPSFTLRMKWAELPWKLAEPSQAEAVDEAGKAVKTVPLTKEKGDIVLPGEAGVFAYRLK